MDHPPVHPLAEPEEALEPPIDPRARRPTVDELEEISHDSIDLEKVPRRLWEQTLAPLHRQQRYSVAHRVADEELREVAGELAFQLDMAECERANAKNIARHRARRTGHPLPTPSADPAVTRTVQVNVRLRADDHQRPAAAAAAAAIKPTTLARALILNGVARILQEHAAGAPAANGSTPNARLSLTP